MSFLLIFGPAAADAGADTYTGVDVDTDAGVDVDTDAGFDITTGSDTSDWCVVDCFDDDCDDAGGSIFKPKYPVSK